MDDHEIIKPSESNFKKKKLILFLIVPLIIISPFVSRYLIILGDSLVKNDHIRRADVIFKIAKVLNPFDYNTNKRMAITKSLLGYWGENYNGDLLTQVSNDQDSISIPILAYHHIRVNPNEKDLYGPQSSTSPEEFKKQMEYLSSNGFHSIRLDELKMAIDQKYNLPSKSIVITIDDGYDDAYTSALPILKANKLTAELFLISDFIGQPGYLSWKDIDEMNNDHIFTFESHTVDHASLPTLENVQIEDEVKNSKQILEKHFGRPVNWLAYPYGDTNDNIIEIVKKVGYLGAISNIPGTKESANNLYLLPRIFVMGGESMDKYISSINDYISTNLSNSSSSQ